MSAKQLRCDACNRRLRPNQHELHLSDPLTGQLVGKYHARPDCQEAASKYMMQPGTVLFASFIHPNRCGPDQERCAGGLSGSAA
jgi:hypothetical protein